MPLFRPVPFNCIPYPSFPHVPGRALVEEVADLLQLGAARAGVVEQVAQLARVGLDLDIVLLELGIALEHQHLVFRATGLACGVHRKRGCGSPGDGELSTGESWARVARLQEAGSLGGQLGYSRWREGQAVQEPCILVVRDPGERRA